MDVVRTLVWGALISALSWPQSSTAQEVDDADRVLDGVLVVNVDLNVSNLVEDVSGIIISCSVKSIYEVYGIVGEGKAFIYDAGTYSEEEFHASGAAFLRRVQFIPVENVFGYGGIRKYNQSVEVLLANEEDEPGPIESWTEGGCDLSLISGHDVFDDDFDEFFGTNPADCSEGNNPFFTCVRPGTSVGDAYFKFSRDFGATSASSGDDN